MDLPEGGPMEISRILERSAGSDIDCVKICPDNCGVLKWLIKEGCPYDKSRCREAAARGGERARKVLEWLNK